MRRRTIAGFAFLAALGLAKLCADTPDGEGTSCDQIRLFAEQRLAAGKADVHPELQFPCRLPKGPLPLQFVIATAPNPIETHLALWFDREVESIQSAADSVGLRFQSAWVPWDPMLLREQDDLEDRQKQEQQKKRVEREPGVLLFRTEKAAGQFPRDLVVLVVPETPTSGIDPKVFCDAVAIVAAETNSTTIALLGPSFSGSFASLANILRGGKICGKAGLQLESISGSATSSSAASEAFDWRSEPASGNQYRTVVHDTRLLWGLLRSWRPVGRVAVLSESETRYGADPSDGAELVLRYPRGISHLRNAYSDQELKTVTGAEPRRSFRSLLTFRIPDVGPATDSTPVFAKDQTPLSQDAVLESIARTLKDKEIQMAGLVATDPFDALFIARYLRDACPNVRLFSLDSDLLWVRAAQDFPFSGTLALTTYPLMEANQGWTSLRQSANNSVPTRKLFPSRSAEGIYNAMRGLLLKSDFLAQNGLADYFDPFECNSGRENQSTCQTPPVWLTVVTRDGYWPLAVDHPGAEWHWPLLAWQSGENRSRLSVGPLPRLWRFLFVTLTAAVLWYCACVLLSLGGAGRHRALAEWGVWQREEGWVARLCYLTISSLSLLAVYFLYAAPIFSLRRVDGAQFATYSATASLVTAVLIAAILAPVCKAFLGPHKKLYASRDQWNYGILAVAGSYAAFLAWSVERLFFARLDLERGFFFAYRSIHVSNSVAPVVPLLFLLSGYLAWGRVHSKRLALLHDRIPWLPTLGTNPEEIVLDEKRAELERVVRDPLPFHWRTLGTFALTVLIWYYLANSLRSLESPVYDDLVVLSLAVLYALLFLTWARIMLIWARLRLFLEGLERHPIRFAFSNLPREAAWSPIFHSSAGRRSYSSDVRTADGLKTLRPYMLPALSGAADQYTAELNRVLKIANSGSRVPWGVHWELRRRLSAVDNLLIESLAPFWRSRGSAENSEADRQGNPVSTAEGLIAGQFTSYIQYTLHQIRNLIYFVTVAFVLSLVALNCYPFQAPRTITTFVTLMFLIFASGIVLIMVQADRDRTLSRITNTDPGKLNGDFFKRLAAYLGLPLVTVVASQVPSWGRFLFSWVQPALESLK